MRDTSNMGRYALAVVLLLCGMWVGLRLPDADQSWLRLTGFVVHRSLLTHGLLVPLFLFWHYQTGGKARQNDPLPRLGLMGLLIGSSIHLAFDLFPRQWYGFALIHVPLYGWASPQFSRTWLFASLLLCLYGGCRLLRGVGELYLALVVSVVAFVWCAQTESVGARPLFALLTLAAVGCVAFILPRPVIHRSAPGE